MPVLIVKFTWKLPNLVESVLHRAALNFGQTSQGPKAARGSRSPGNLVQRDGEANRGDGPRVRSWAGSDAATWREKSSLRTESRADPETRAGGLCSYPQHHFILD